MPIMEEWPGHAWPVNEILLQSLVLAGKSDDEIAELYHVDAEHVATLRAKFGF